MAHRVGPRQRLTGEVKLQPQARGRNGDSRCKNVQAGTGTQAGGGR